MIRIPTWPFGKYLALLGKESSQKFRRIILAQSILGFLDLIGLAAIGVVASLAVRGVQSNQVGGRTETVLIYLQLDSLDFQIQVALLSLIATFFLVLKTLLTVVLNRKILYSLSQQSAKLADDLLSKVLASSILRIKGRSSQEIQYAVGAGVSAIALGIVGTTAAVITDISSLTILLIGLLVVDPVVAVSSVCLFSLIGIITFRLTHRKANHLGRAMSQLSVSTQINIQELLGSYREIFVRNRREYYLWRISKLRQKYADTLAEQTFIPNISKYLLEVSVLVGALFMAGILFYLHDASRAVAGLAIFIIAGSRIAPAVLRLQQGLVQVRANQGVAENTYRLITSFQNESSLSALNETPSFQYEGFKANISVLNVSFSFPKSQKILFENLSLEILVGELVAIAGPSGSGKSTLMDLLLGLQNPMFGSVTISEEPPRDVIRKFPGAIGYVPQEIGLIDGTIRENLCLGFDVDFFTDESYWSALEQAQLFDFVRGLPDDLNFIVGEGGSRLSGGQRQRLGIARALLTKPKLLLLDEATSSLDSQTEQDISQAITNLRGNVTTVMIAHRLSTIKMADKVFYLENGKVLASGSFDSVRDSVANFEKQAGLQGL